MRHDGILRVFHEIFTEFHVYTQPETCWLMTISLTIWGLVSWHHIIIPFKWECLNFGTSRILITIYWGLSLNLPFKSSMCVVNIPDVYIYISTSPKQVSTRYFTGKKRGRALMSSQSLFVDLQHHGSPPARCVETVDPSCRKISKHNPQKKRAQLESLDLQEKHKRWKYYIFGAPKIWCFSFFF